MNTPKNLPWIVLGVGAVGIASVLVLRKKPMKSTLPVATQVKAAQTIQASTDPTVLQKLASGLQKTGLPSLAGAALQKAADLTGSVVSIPAIVTGSVKVPAITATPNFAVPTVRPSLASKSVSTSVPTSMASSEPGVPNSVVVNGKYKVASGDNPTSISKRFGTTLSVLAKANGAQGARITKGTLYANETLKLPSPVTDNGPMSGAKGTPS